MGERSETFHYIQPQRKKAAFPEKVTFLISGVPETVELSPGNRPGP
jgi:hypothetical protein